MPKEWREPEESARDRIFVDTWEEFSEDIPEKEPDVEEVMDEGLLASIQEEQVFAVDQSLEESGIKRVVPEDSQDDLQRDLAAVLNRYSAENESNTPDYLLAEFMLGCLHSYNQAHNARNAWMGGVQE